MRIGSLWMCAYGVLLVADDGAGAKPRAKAPEEVALINGASCARRCAVQFCPVEEGRIRESCLITCFWVCGDNDVDQRTATAPAKAAAAPTANDREGEERLKFPGWLQPKSPTMTPSAPAVAASRPASRAIDIANPYAQ